MTCVVSLLTLSEKSGSVFNKPWRYHDAAVPA